MNLVILGPPGSGKGTQAKLLATHFGLTHVSSGDLLRQETQKDPSLKSILTSGQLVPFPTVLSVLKPALLSAGGFILDGTPRNLEQATALDEFFAENNLSLNHAILLTLSDAEATNRLLKRAQIEKRSDDNADTIRERLEIYHQQTQPVIDYYRRQGKLLEIDGSPAIQTIFRDILAKL